MAYVGPIVSTFGPNLFNTFLGVSAGNITLSTGNDNTGIGYQSLKSLTTGHDNTCVGELAGTAITTGRDNCVIGSQAFTTAQTGEQNVIIGFQAGRLATSGSYNVGVGYSCLANIVGDIDNVAIGFLSLSSLANSTGANVAVGYDSLAFLATGGSNIALGYQAGINYTGAESNNIVIGNGGTLGESAAIHIGTSGTHTTATIAGVTGVSVSNPVPVMMNSSTGQLGTGSGAALAFKWTDVTGASQTIAAGNGYLADRGGGVAFTLPASSTIGDVFRIAGVQGSWTLAQAAGQQIKFGNKATTAGATGSLASTNAQDCVEMVASNTSASSIWIVISSIGNITVA